MQKCKDVRKFRVSLIFVTNGYLKSQKLQIYPCRRTKVKLRNFNTVDDKMRHNFATSFNKLYSTVY